MFLRPLFRGTVLEEYGKIVDPKHPTDHTERNAYMTSAFQAAEASASSGGPLAGRSAFLFIFYFYCL